jgi:hypothetical protein
MYDAADVFIGYAATGLICLGIGAAAGCSITESKYQRQAVGYGYAKFDPVTTKFSWNVPAKIGVKPECGCE